MRVNKEVGEVGLKSRSQKWVKSFFVIVGGRTASQVNDKLKRRVGKRVRKEKAVLVHLQCTLDIPQGTWVKNVFAWYIS